MHIDEPEEIQPMTQVKNDSGAPSAICVLRQIRKDRYENSFQATLCEGVGSVKRQPKNPADYDKQIGKTLLDFLSSVDPSKKLTN